MRQPSWFIRMRDVGSAPVPVQQFGERTFMGTVPSPFIRCGTGDSVYVDSAEM